MQENDVFSGTWTMSAGRSSFDPKHRPTEGILRFERVPDGYMMYAEGVCDGKKVAEQPQHLIPDGIEHAIPGAAPNVTCVCTRPDANTIRVLGRMGDRVVGEGSYVVSADGRTLTATMRGIDAQERPFETMVVWDRAS